MENTYKIQISDLCRLHPFLQLCLYRMKEVTDTIQLDGVCYFTILQGQVVDLLPLMTIELATTLSLCITMEQNPTMLPGVSVAC